MLQVNQLPPGPGWLQRSTNKKTSSESILSSASRGRLQSLNDKSVKMTQSLRGRRSRSSDNHFQIQHDDLMARQKFKTKTTKSHSSVKPPHFDAESVVSFSSRRSGCIYPSESHESGYISQLSRSTSGTYNNGGNIPTIIENPAFTHLRGTMPLKVKRIIDDLNKAIDIDRRMAAISNACSEFDHWDVETHDIELELGCSNVLCFILSMTDNEDEIRMICAALEMVFRASSDSIHKTYREVGPSVLPLLFKVCERCENSKFKHAEVSILNISKILLYFSRVPELRENMVSQDGMLNSLTRVSIQSLNEQLRILRMRTIANLSNAEANKTVMIGQPGLLETILKTAATDSSESAREYASASLMDLASSISSQEEMASNDRLLATLVKLVVTDEKDETREYAVTAIQNLAFAKGNRVRLVQFSDGVILEALKKALSCDKNDKSRRRAAGAITNLACEETAELLEGHKGLLDVIAKAVIKDSNEDVQKRSCLALTKIISSASIDSKYFKESMIALVHASGGRNSIGISAVFRLKARDSSRRDEMARIPGLLDALAEIYSGNSYNMKDKDNAIRALMHLTNGTDNRKVMCNKTILKCLVDAADLDEIYQTETRDSAVISIERLATEISNRQYMARHPQLLRVIAKATERECASELNGEKEKSSHPKLAKQLLMSLLLAM